MPELPPPLQPTVEAVYAHYVAARKDWRRDHLGASMVGDEKCLRLLWYAFRWASDPQHPGRILRLFESGQREEERVVANLKAAGVTVVEVDPSTDEQWRIAFVGGHVGGGSDGAVLGIREAPKTWHLLEVKTANEKWFKAMAKKGVREARPGYFAQMQVYMLGLKLTRAYFWCTHKDTDSIYTERVKFDRPYAVAAIAKLEHVVRSATPPPRISDDPTWFECKFCDFYDVCHDRRLDRLERNCRTCASSSPTEDGGWWCDLHESHLSSEKQREGCPEHVFVPQVIPFECVEASESDRSATYRRPDGSFFVDHGREFREVE